jgi:hypothetical protein
MSPSAYQNLVDAYNLLKRVVDEIANMQPSPGAFDHARNLARTAQKEADHISHQAPTP